MANYNTLCSRVVNLTYLNLQDINNTGQHTFCSKKVSTVLEYFDVAISDNDTGFSKLGLVFKMVSYFCFKKVLKIHKF